MKQKFIDMVPKMIKPWVDGSTGTPWAFSTGNLVAIGNVSLEPDQVVNKDGDIEFVYLKFIDVNEAMEELGFKSSFFDSGPNIDFSFAWEVELLS